MKETGALVVRLGLSESCREALLHAISITPCLFFSIQSLIQTGNMAGCGTANSFSLYLKNILVYED